MRRIQGENPMPWLFLDKSKLMGTFENVPERDEIPEPVNEQLVVELYSK
jgi:small subunit ribosomal protein S4